MSTDAVPATAGQVTNATSVEPRAPPTQVGRKVAFAIAANIAGAVLGYGTLLIVGRTIAPAAFGSFVFAGSVGGLFSLVCTLGLAAGQQRLVARGHDLARVMGVTLRLRLGLAVAALLALAIAGVVLRSRGVALTDATTPAVLGGAFAFQIVALARQVLSDMWAGQQRVGRVEGLKLVDSLIVFAFVANAGLLVAHLAGRWMPGPPIGAWWADALGIADPLTIPEVALLLLGCHLAAKTLTFLLAATWAIGDGVRFGPWDPVLARELWAFALPLALTGAIQLIVTSTDVVLLGFFWTAHEVGLYGTAQKLSVLGAVTAIAASSVLFPRFAQLNAAGAREQEDRTLRDAERWTLLIVAPVTAALVALAPAGIHIAVGDKYLDAAGPLRWLALAVFAYTLQMPLSARFLGHGLTGVLVQVGLLNAVANVGLNLLFIPEQALGWGASGAAAATMVAGLLAYGLLRSRARTEFGTPWLSASTARIAAAGTGLGLLWWGAADAFPGGMDRVWELAAWGLAGMAAYLAMLLAFGALEKKDLDLLHKAAHPRALWHELRGR